MTMPAPTSIKAVKAVRDLTGLPLVAALEQTRAILTLAHNGTLLPGDILMSTNKGLIPLAKLYAAVGVTEGGWE
jgi:hypothetical protein